MNRPTMTSPGFGNVFEDILEVLWAPSKVFERAQYRTYGKYMVVLVVIGSVIAFIAARLTGPWMDAQFDLSMQQAAAKGAAVPAGAMETARKFAGAVVYASPLFLVVLGGFVGGLLLLLGGKVVSAPVSYGQAVLIATLGSVPRILGMLVGGVMGLVSDAEKARSMFDLSVGPTRFLDAAKTSPVLMQFLAGFDLFNLWQLLIFAIGIAVIARVSKSTGFIGALIAWVLGTVIPLIPTLLAN